jgi:hypothetical protein
MLKQSLSEILVSNAYPTVLPANHDFSGGSMITSGLAVIQCAPKRTFTVALSELQWRGGPRSPWPSSIRAAFQRETVGRWFRETRS